MTRTWIEQDPERAPIWRYAWDLLLEDRYTLEQICEKLHAQGYRYRSGRPFVTIKKNNRRKANINTLSSIFHNWAYAGWVTSKAGDIPPKTISGDWELIVTTEEFEKGLVILENEIAKLCGIASTIIYLKGSLFMSIRMDVGNNVSQDRHQTQVAQVEELRIIGSHGLQSAFCVHLLMDRYLQH